ncbi:23S rRNA (adenine(2030)-N(6))-methyltransferase RlmJ [Granulosicoccus antarcticus]|uniref:Ribosomal RNA large subunit methyltransferase J n=1 Tax=Granulosicoccus antarcticus IMCC3135 TaxID=1192854 RepID=A0A2Z2NS61_9GAMM|nr:23S rRNA (adenine(2030)-N(6))-methyltransferase RlmJ [Granulosicoccus antarcticus]ASJ74109.1 Ribosomal RNA large subunit methyltransferase J [Granulosicoccus antarcticus IMCC3135]
MLSYRHGYHAGNHADVLKHTVQIQCIDYLSRKETPFWIIDTHAGAGGYELNSAFAQKNREYQSGIERIHQTSNLNSAALLRYRDLVRSFNPESTDTTQALSYYPGSPQLSQALLRKQDKLKLFELHSNEAPDLQNRMSRHRRQVQLVHGDGLAGLKALLPPAPRRALTLIDPAYELPDDYADVIKALQSACTRFATGVYALWYPVLDKPAVKTLVPQLCDTLGLPWLSARLDICDPSLGGMTGSGMFVINPPWTLQQSLAEALPEMVSLLGQDNKASYSLTASE